MYIKITGINIFKKYKISHLQIFNDIYFKYKIEEIQYISGNSLIFIYNIIVFLIILKF